MTIGDGPEGKPEMKGKGARPSDHGGAPKAKGNGLFLRPVSDLIKPKGPGPRERDMPGRDGAWWVADKPIEIDCPECGPARDLPLVKHIGNERWILDGECYACGWNVWTCGVGTETIRGWKVGPWSRALA